MLLSLFLQVIYSVCSLISLPITCVRGRRLFLHLHTGRDVFSSSDHEERDQGGGRVRGREKERAELKMRAITAGLSAGCRILNLVSTFGHSPARAFCYRRLLTRRGASLTPQTLRLLQDAPEDAKDQLVTLFYKTQKCCHLLLFPPFWIDPEATSLVCQVSMSKAQFSDGAFAVKIS